MFLRVQCARRFFFRADASHTTRAADTASTSAAHVAFKRGYSLLQGEPAAVASRVRLSRIAVFAYFAVDSIHAVRVLYWFALTVERSTVVQIARQWNGTASMSKCRKHATAPAGAARGPVQLGWIATRPGQWAPAAPPHAPYSSFRPQQRMQ